MLSEIELTWCEVCHTRNRLLAVGSLVLQLRLKGRSSIRAMDNFFLWPDSDVAATSAITCLLTSAANAQSKTEKLLSYGAAKVIATTALETCQAKGLRVSATVVNRGDDAILQLPGDAARPHTAENSGRTAYAENTVRTEYRRLR